jgi:UDP-N-acetylglucosamine--N-acetylmuramyl-(pentapeptide) pyrophosphoryl-undecaprenol N-acetylglucosamine transferase
MQKQQHKRFIISGGGTGGHIFPAVAIADELRVRYPDCEILFVGASDRMEMEKVPAAGYEIKGLWISGLQRNLTLKNLLFPLKLISSIWKSKKIVRKFKPDVVIGTGGYASAAVLYAASSKGIPTLIQEQNNYAGLTNKWLSKKVNKICVSFDNMDKYFPGEKLVVAGNPVRSQFISEDFNQRTDENYKAFDLNPEKKTVLVVGGSLGARSINLAIEKNLQEFESKQVQLLWQTGKLFVEESQKYLGEWVQPREFIYNMNEAYKVADLIISRAGAIAISELCLVGKPVVLVPLKTAAEDHQTKNAKALLDRDAALLVGDGEASEKLVSEALSLMGNINKRESMSQNIRKMAKPESTVKIVDEIVKLM